MEKRDEMLLQVGIAAALADGACDQRERAHLDELARAAGTASTTPLVAHLPGDLATRLGSAEARRAAYDLAVAVCHADGVANDAETRFLASLRETLGLDAASVADQTAIAGALAGAPVAGDSVGGEATASTDDLILQHAMLAGALELLPQSLATMAVIPVQLRLVYQIGRQHGQKLDAAQAKDLLATVGIGAATQVFDGVARRVLGGVARGVLGRLLGGLAGGVAGAAAGAGTVFAATYALGHAAEQYYAQGRVLRPADLRALFGTLRDQALELYPRIQAQIEDRARSLDLQQVVSSLTRA
jgi:uncharacterized protein (DUF697 family)